MDGRLQHRRRIERSQRRAPGETVWQIDLGSRSSCRLRIEPQTWRRRPARRLCRPGHGLCRECRQAADPVETAIRRLLGAAHVVFADGARRRCASRRFRARTSPWPSSRIAVERCRKRSMFRCRSRSSARGGPIVVEASTASRTNRMWSLPRIDVPGAVRRDGQVELTVVNPLQAAAIRRGDGDGPARGPLVCGRRRRDLQTPRCRPRAAPVDQSRRADADA